MVHLLRQCGRVYYGSADGVLQTNQFFSQFIKQEEEIEFDDHQG